MNDELTPDFPLNDELTPDFPYQVVGSKGFPAFSGDQLTKLKNKAPQESVTVKKFESFGDCSTVTGADLSLTRQESGESTWEPVNDSEWATNSANGSISSLLTLPFSAFRLSNPPSEAEM